MRSKRASGEKRKRVLLLFRKGLLLPTLIILIAFVFASSVALAEEKTSQESTDQQADQATGQQAAQADELKVEEVGSEAGKSASEASGSLSALQKQVLEQGPLPADPAALKQAKDEAEKKAKELSPKASDASSGDLVVTPSSSGKKAEKKAKKKADKKAQRASTSQQAPTYSNNFEGINDPNWGPSDSTGAVGTTRYIELVNDKFGIYNKTNSFINSGTLSQLTGGTTGSLTDPQVIWDPSQNRFFYVALRLVSASENRLDFGFSKSTSPSSSSTTDWCKYTINFGSRLPDYPKLGDTANRTLVGVNGYNASTKAFLGSDLYSMTKPPTGTISTCPAASTITVGTLQNLPGAFTPVPANQIDGSTTGFAIARNSSLPSTRLVLYNVVENATTKTFNLTTRSLTVPSYTVPANAPQPGTTNKLDAADARPTQAVSAIDPSHGATTAVWIQHTIFGGSGAQVRWYEINPSTATTSLFQSGNIFGSSGLFVFNGDISPNRVRNGSTGSLGNSMVLGFNTSSTAQRPDIRTASKIGTAALTVGPVVKASSFSLDDFTCHRSVAPGICRWGDYAGASPDPTPLSTDTNGKVWLTNQYVRATGSSSVSGWGTRNIAAKP